MLKYIIHHYFSQSSVKQELYPLIQSIHYYAAPHSGAALKGNKQGE